MQLTAFLSTFFELKKVECRKYEQLHPQNKGIFASLSVMWTYVICLSLYSKLADLYFKRRHILEPSYLIIQFHHGMKPLQKWWKMNRDREGKARYTSICNIKKIMATVEVYLLQPFYYANLAKFGYLFWKYGLQNTHKTNQICYVKIH